MDKCGVVPITMMTMVKKDFFAMLREHSDLDRHARWSDIKKKFDGDARYKSVDSSGQREDWWREYCKMLKEEKKRAKEKEREHKKSDKEKHKKTKDKDREREEKKERKRSESGGGGGHKSKNPEDATEDNANSTTEDPTKEDEKEEKSENNNMTEDDEIKDSEEMDTNKDDDDDKDKDKEVEEEEHHEDEEDDDEASMEADMASDREKEKKDKERQARAEQSMREREKEVQRTMAAHMRDRDKEREQHKRDEAIQHFNALLVDLVRNADLSWKEVKRMLRKDQRWDLTDSLSREEKEKLFNEHVETIIKKKREKFRELLDETAVVSLTSSWREIKRVVKEDPRYTKFASSERCEREFKDYLKDKLFMAKGQFKELLQETKLITHKSLQMVRENQSHMSEIEDILKNDKRYLVLEFIAQERTQLILNYLEELDRRGPPPPPTASEPSRRTMK